MLPRRILAPVAISLALVATACGSDDNSAADTTAAPAAAETTAAADAIAPEMADIVDTAVGAGSFTTLVAAVKAAGLVETLKGAGPFTVFAPTDEAFAALPAGLVDKLLLPENKEVLTKILTYHVIGANVMAADVKPGKVTTVEGSDAEITVDGTAVKIAGANVVSTDIEATNGVIHVIDAVIIPPDVDPSAL